MSNSWCLEKLTMLSINWWVGEWWSEWEVIVIIPKSWPLPSCLGALDPSLELGQIPDTFPKNTVTYPPLNPCQITCSEFQISNRKWAFQVAQWLKNLPANAEDARDHSWDGKIPWRRKWQRTPIFLPGKFHGQRSLVGYSPWGHKESDATEYTTTESGLLFFAPHRFWMFLWKNFNLGYFS